jgi:hypothetical protein
MENSCFVDQGSESTFDVCMKRVLTFASSDQPNIHGRFENKNAGKALCYPFLMRIEGTNTEEHHESDYFDCDRDCAAFKADELSASECG